MAAAALIGLAVFSVSISSFKVVATGLFIWAVAWALIPVERWQNCRNDQPNGAFPFWLVAVIAGAVFMGAADFAIHGSGTNWATKAGFLAWTLSFAVGSVALLVTYVLSRLRRSRNAAGAATQPGLDQEPPPLPSLQPLADGALLFVASLVGAICVVISIFSQGESGLRWLHGGLFAVAAGLLLNMIYTQGRLYERFGFRSTYLTALALLAFAIFMGCALLRVHNTRFSFYAAGLFAWAIALTLQRVEAGRPPA